ARGGRGHLRRPPDGDEPGPGRPARAGRGHQRPRLRGQDLPGLLRRPGETAMKTNQTTGYGRSPQRQRRVGFPSLTLHALIAVFLPCVPWFSSSAFAADAGSRTPYRLDLVVVVGKDPALTDLFRDRFESELRDALQTSLGELARVEVRRDHPRAREVEDKG